MNCDGIRGLLSAYLDGELSPGDLLRVEQHLRRCHWCADEVDSLRQTVALVASLDEVEVPAAFHAQLHNRLVALGPPVAAVNRIPVQRPRYSNRRWAIPAAAAAAALAIGLTSYHQLGGLSGVEAPSHQFPPQVAIANPKEPVGPPPIIAGEPTQTPGETTPKPPASPDPKASPVTPDPSDAAPLGPQAKDPSRATVVSVSTDVPKVPTGDTKKYFQATVSLPIDQLANLSAKYTIQNQNGELLIDVPTAQFEADLKQVSALPGVTLVVKTEEKDITQGVAQATEVAKQSKDYYNQLLVQSQQKSPAEQDEMKPRLESSKQEMDKDQANLDKLRKLADTSIILLKVLGR